MLNCVLRVLLLLAFALHWGGLTFYTGFVVRISHDVLDDPMDGGLITQRVTELLQGLAAIVLVLMLCNCAHVFRKLRGFGIALSVCAGLAGISLIGLFVVHGHLDMIIDIEAMEILDRDAFTIGHRRYNQLTTIQWLASLSYLPITVFAWRFMDENATGNSAKSATA